jgi:small subunit ribosomal protein S12
MVTFAQLRRFPRIQKSRTNRKKALNGCPHQKGFCVRVYKMAPKKPNSARRSVTRLLLNSGRLVSAYIPGIGHTLQRFSSVLIRGGRVPDLPGINFKVIRNKFDCLSVRGRRTSRSLYGVKRWFKPLIIK